MPGADSAAPFKRCDLYDLDEAEARAALTAYLTPAAPPAGDVRFPGKAKPAESPPHAPELASFPGKRSELPNAGLEKAGAPPVSVPASPRRLSSCWRPVAFAAQPEDDRPGGSARAVSERIESWEGFPNRL